MHKRAIAAFAGLLLLVTAPGGAQGNGTCAPSTARNACDQREGPLPPLDLSEGLLSDRDELSGKQLITFSEYPRNTSISNQYVNKGIEFGGDNPFIALDRDNPTSPVLSGSPLFFGAIEGRFVEPGNASKPALVNGFTLDAGYFNRAQSVRLSWYDVQGRLIARTSNARTGIRNLKVEGLGIARWRMEAIDNEPAGFAIDNVEFSAPFRTIFAGIFGGGIGDIPDDPDAAVDLWRDESIAELVKSRVPFCQSSECRPREQVHLSRIGSSRAGGIVSLGFFMTSMSGRSSLSTPGNSEITKTFIVDNYKPGDRVYVVGFSAGGGDAQNVLEKLDRLKIPVEVSGHIDSVEFGNDATIPPSTRIAKGYYQTQSPAVVRGENKLTAKNSKVTSVTNTKIKDPVGPDDAEVNTDAHHRNMDNDPRVWNALKTSITSSLNRSAAKSMDGHVSAEPGCPECEDATNDVVEWTARLSTALENDRSGEDLYRIRSQMASAVKSAQAFRDLRIQHDRAADAPVLRENLTAVALQVNPGGFLKAVEDEAASVTDYPLFVAITHSLVRVGNREAKQSAIRLVGRNRLDVAPGKVIDAVVGAWSGGAETGDDAGWMTEWVRGGELTDQQMYAVARIVAPRKGKPEIRTLLHDIEERIRDERLRARVMTIANE